MEYNLFELSRSTACRTRRYFPVSVSKKDETLFKKAALIKKSLKDYFAGEIKKEEIEESLCNDFKDIPYNNEEQRRIHAADAARQVLRYIKSEKRHLIPANSEKVTLEGEDGTKIVVLVKPDYIVGMSKGTILSDVAMPENTIEIIKIKTSKPQSGVSAKTDLGLYSMLLYGRKLAKPGTKVMIRASYYYLRKKNDSYSADDPNFDEDFFSLTGAGNIVSLNEIVEMPADPSDPVYTQLDQEFAPLIKEFYDGIDKEECSKEDCEKCDLYNLCNYTEPPIAIDKISVQQNAKNILLSPSQREAVEYEHGYCRINAGAGAGKTMVVAYRAVTLLLKGVAPEEICLITFTNSGVEEMRERIKRYNDDFETEIDIEPMVITTFNAFGNDILKLEYDKLGFTCEPKLIDDVERSRIITDMLARHVIKDLNYRDFNADNKYRKGALAIARNAFDIIKRETLGYGDEDKLHTLLGPDRRFCSVTAAKELLELYDEYDDILRQNNLIEFADQEVLLFRLLHDDPFYLERFGFKHIIVDEYQDTNAGQLELIKMLCKCPTFESLMIVGDDSQAIFSFRDTSPEYIINFPKYIGEEVDDINLLENYRSTPEIIDFANKLNAKNKHRIAKNLISKRSHGKPVVVKGFHSSEDEIKFVTENIEKHLSDGVSPEDIAVICSTKYELMKMADVLSGKGIPSVLLNPEPYIDNSRVRAFIALVSAYQDINSETDLLTFINARRGGDVLQLSASEIEDEIAALRGEIVDLYALPFDEKKEKIMEMGRSIDHNDDEVYKSFLEGFEYKNMFKIMEYCNDFYAFGSNTAVRRTHNYPGIVLTTAHSSKGLEWPVCYDMVTKFGEEEKIRTTDREEETRRLLFVASTRARDELYITSKYVAYGKKGAYTYNRFLIDAYDCVGQEFSISSIETEKELMDLAAKEAKKKAKEEAKEAKAS